MQKRWIIYFALAFAAIPVVIWFAFGPLIIRPYELFTSPVEWLFREPDVLRDSVLSGLVWSFVAVFLDSLVTRIARRRSAV